MSILTFDTLKFVKTLEAAGVPELQAEAFSTAVRESHEAADVATKGDIAELRHEMSDLRKDMDIRFVGMDIRFASMDARFAGVNSKLEKLELRMTIKLGSIVIAGIGVLTLIFKFL